MYVLGISGFYHDSAAALLKDGELIAAAQEERFTRIKHDPSFPHRSIQYVMSEGKIKLSNLDAVVFYDKPFVKFDRIFETFVDSAPFGWRLFSKVFPTWINEKLFLKRLLAKELDEIEQNFNSKNLKFSDHHMSHAASCFYPSPFDEAIILTLDGVGEWATTAVAIGKGDKIYPIKEILFPNSLGLLYSAFTQYLGFKVNSGEYKMMGLAPYGKPIFTNKILSTLIDVKTDGSFALKGEYFEFTSKERMINSNFCAVFDMPQRHENDPIEQRHNDIAASIQEVLEQTILKIVTSLSKEFQQTNICLAGGVALNCVANSKLFHSALFKNIYIQPAAGDAGAALGAAMAYYYSKNQRKKDHYTTNPMKNCYLGPEYSQSQIKQELEDLGAVFEEHSEMKIISKTANLLDENKVVGWFQGRMEFGPRALGNRSILANPTSTKMRQNLNLKIKKREGFRPFAPIIKQDSAKYWFDPPHDSPYMLYTAYLKEKFRYENFVDDSSQPIIKRASRPNSVVPAITHVDFSARLQTITGDDNPRLYALICEFEQMTGVPMLVNTSFNVRGEPIVCSPADAFKCFMNTEMDAMAIGNYLLLKEFQIKPRRLFAKNYTAD